MLEFLRAPILGAYPALTPLALIDISITAFLFYLFLSNVRGRRAANILAGVAVLGGLYLAADLLGLNLLTTLLASLAPYIPLGLILLFQSEIRRVLTRLGRRDLFGLGGIKRQEWVDEVLLAVEQLARSRTGALIVIEREIGLRTFVESGVILDALLSQDLLQTIFNPKTPLHDGAVILRNGRLIAAGCFLPLSTNPALVNALGTRHRAAIGVTEDTDSLAIIVSEESGSVSVAEGGEITRHLTIAQLDERIQRHLRSRAPSRRDERDDASDAVRESAESSSRI